MRSDAPIKIGGVAGGGEQRSGGGSVAPSSARIRACVALADVGAIGDLHAGLHAFGKFLIGIWSFASSFSAVPGGSNSGWCKAAW